MKHIYLLQNRIDKNGKILHYAIYRIEDYNTIYFIKSGDRDEECELSEAMWGTFVDRSHFEDRKGYYKLWDYSIITEKRLFLELI